MKKVFIFYRFGDSYEQSADYRDFESRDAAQDWINQEIQSHPPGYLEIVAIVEGWKLDITAVEIIQKMKIVEPGK